MQIYRDALKAIAAGEVQAVDESSIPSYATIRELKDEGYVTAINSSSDLGDSFIQITITLRGRRFLDELNATA